jgi:flagellar hook-length control protein FliK
MNIPAISNLVVAAGGKAAPPLLGELLAQNGLPLDFAALLAGQIPSADLTLPPSTIAEATPASNLPLDAELLSDHITPASLVKDSKLLPVDNKQTDKPSTDESAAAILAALSAGPKQLAQTLPSIPKPSVAEAASPLAKPEREGKGSEKDEKNATQTELAPTDPGLVAQYNTPPVSQTGQSRLPDSGERDKSNASGQTARTGNSLSAAREGHAELPQRSGSTATEPAPLAMPGIGQTAPLAEPRVIAHPDTANTAILAGDSNGGNSGNTPSFASTLAATGATTTAAAPATHASAPVPMIATPLNTPNWSNDFATRVVWLAKNDQQVAQININPPQMGPVQISISMNGDQASATFASPHPEVRQAIQDSLPQLREMLTAAGISLGQTNVGSQMPSQNREAAYQFANGARSSGENAILSPDSHASSAQAGIPIQRGRGLVDLFA